MNGSFCSRFLVMNSGDSEGSYFNAPQTVVYMGAAIDNHNRGVLVIHMRKYEFNWDLIGDIEDGRENLGTQMEVEIYRLMQFTLRDTIEQRLGESETDQIFFEAGKLAGMAFYEHAIAPVDSLDEFVNKAKEALREKKIGILRIESVEDGEVILTLDEDLDCSGLPLLEYETCIYDEGFVSALFEGFTGQMWRAREIDCWCTGARTCRFQVKLVDENNAGI